MKIGILLDQLVPGGVQKAAIEETIHLKSIGHDVELLVIMRTTNKAYQYEDLLKGINIRFFSDEYPLIFKRAFKLPIFEFLSTSHILSPFILPDHVSDREYDLIISHGTTTCLTAQKLWEKRKIPYMAFIWDPMTYILKKVYSTTFLRHLFFILLPLASRYERSLMRDSAGVLVASKVHSDFLNEEYGIKAEVIHPGGYPSESIPDKRGDAVIAFTRWDNNKNPYLLLELAKAIPKSKIRLAGVWTNLDHYTAFQEKIKENGLSDRVDVVPRLDKALLEELSKSARVWVHPNFEAFGMGGLEAAGFGCPIIIPEGSGVTEIFAHGTHGFFPKKGDVDSYIQYVNKLLLDERMAWKMGSNAWEVAKKNTWLDHTKKVESLILRKI